MTQLQLGLRQQFLPGRTLQLRGEQAMFSAEAIDSMIRAHQLSISRAVRDTFVEIQYRLRGEAILENARAVLAEMTGVVRDYYANGRAQQHDVLLADLEVTRLDDRLLRMQQAQQEARARLSQWIGAKAYDSVDTQWSDMAAVAPREQLFGDLGQHPQLQAGRRRIHAAETAVDIAREQYKPGWAVELTYGDRSGNAADGRARSDFLFASVTVDLPLFRDSRQDRSLSAAALELDAETARVADHRRRLARDLEQSLATLSALTSRIALYEDQLIPQAKESSEAALAAYQSDVSDFSTLLRAQLIEFELQLDLARAEADRRQIVATVDYLTGDKQ